MQAKFVLRWVSVLIFMLYTAVSWSNVVTFEFEGSIANAGAEGDSVSGEVTFDSTVPGTDVRGTHDRGDRILYAGAVQSFSFTTSGGISRSFTGGDIQLFNDYQPCLGRQAGACILYGDTERDRLHFVFDFQGTPDNLSLVVSGTDQSFLATGVLPQTMPTDGYYRTDFFFNEGDTSDPDYLDIGSHDIIIITDVAQPAPTRVYTDVATVGDINGNGVRDTAVVSDQIVTILDGETGAWLKNLLLFWGPWQVYGMVTVDSNHDDMPELAALGQHREKGKILVEIQDIATRKKMSQIRYFAYEDMTPIGLTVGDVDFDGSPDIGVLAVRADGRVAVEYRNAATGAKLPEWVSDRIWLPRD